MSHLLIHCLAISYGFALLYIGILHFVDPTIFVEIMPAYFPRPIYWVYLTGVMEIAAGLTMIYPKSRHLSGRFLLLFLPVIYLANINMWLHDVAFRGYRMTQNEHILRLLAQIVLLIVAFGYARLWPPKREFKHISSPYPPLISTISLLCWTVFCMLQATPSLLNGAFFQG